MSLPTNPDGSLREYTGDEIEEMDIRTADVRGGAHPTHRRAFRQSSVTRQFLVRYNTFEDFCGYMLGGSVVYDDAGVDRLSRLPPQHWPGREWVVATRIDEAKGFGKVSENDADGVPVYPDMLVTVGYEHVPFVVRDDADAAGDETSRYVQTLPTQSDVSYLNLPGGVMQYVRSGGAGEPQGTPIQHSIGFPIPTSVIRKKWIRLPYDAWGPGTALFERVNGNREAGTKPYVGTVNTETIFGYPPGTMLFLGVEEEQVLDPTAEGLFGASWDLTYSWLYRPVAPHTWAYYWSLRDDAPTVNGWYFTAKASDATYYDTADLPDDTSLFNARDHNDLFKVGAVA